MRTLADLAPGHGARLAGFAADLDPAVARRLADLGLRPGTLVETVRRAPFGGPAVFRLRGVELCLRRVQARAVLLHGEGTAP